MSRSEKRPQLFGEKKKSSPQLWDSSSLSFILRYFVFLEFGFSLEFIYLLDYLRSPPSHNPSLLFHIRVYSVAFAIIFSDFDRDGAHPLFMDALAEMSEVEMRVHEAFQRRRLSSRVGVAEFFSRKISVTQFQYLCLTHPPIAHKIARGIKETSSLP